MPEKGETPLTPTLLLEESAPLGRQIGVLLVLILAVNEQHTYWCGIQPYRGGDQSLLVFCVPLH